MDLQDSPASSSSSPKTPGLYVHIPFCLSKCPYCNFHSETSLEKIPDFLEALLREMEMVGPGFDVFDTVYIGGGTPSLLGPKQLEKVITKIRNHFPLASTTEVTLEANPADLDFSLLESLREAGVNRLSLGIQSFDQKVLDFLARRHSVKQAITAIETSRQAGFDHIGLDLIFGVPGQTKESWLHTLSRAVDFSPEHISCYQLTIEKETPLGTACREGQFFLPPEEELFDFFMATAEKLEKDGFIQYEVSNFARGTTYASRHNQKYWNHTPYLGLGPAAHSFSGKERWWNFNSVDHYIAALRSGNLPIQEKEVLSLDQLRMEAFFLGLRTRAGIDLRSFSSQYQYDLWSKKREMLSSLQDQGFLSVENGRLQPTRAGLAVADSLALI